MIGGISVGAVWVYDGPIAGSMRLTDDYDALISGGDPGLGFAEGVAWIDDAAAVGAHQDGRASQGAVHVFEGPLVGWVQREEATLTFSPEAEGTTYLGEAARGLAGVDFDGDGLEELVAGAWGDDEAAENAGAVYLVDLP